MKSVLSLSLITLVALLPATLAWAQRGGRGIGKTKAPPVRSQVSTQSSSARVPAAAQRSNKGGEVRGIQRAEQVQQMRTHGDTEHGVASAPGLEQAEERHTVRTRAELGKGAAKGQEARRRPSASKEAGQRQD